MMVYDRVSEQHQKMHAYVQSHVKKYKEPKTGIWPVAT